MSKEAPHRDLLEVRWQPVAVADMEKRRPPRSLKNAVWDIGSSIVLGAAQLGGPQLSRDWTALPWLAVGAVLGLVAGVREWLSRPYAINSAANPRRAGMTA
jgi:hypothetical protein